jgi:hypothetical protein
MSSIQEDEFEGLSFRQCAEIIVFDKKDADFSQKQINALVEQHNKRLEAVLALPELEDEELSGEITTAQLQVYTRNELRASIREAIQEMMK